VRPERARAAARVKVPRLAKENKIAPDGRPTFRPLADADRPVAILRGDPTVPIVDGVLDLSHPRHSPASPHRYILALIAADQRAAHLVRPPATLRIRNRVHSSTSSRVH